MEEEVEEGGGELEAGMGEVEGEGEGEGERGKHVQFIPIPYEQCDTPELGVTKLSVAPHKPGKKRRKRRRQ